MNNAFGFIYVSWFLPVFLIFTYNYFCLLKSLLWSQHSQTLFFRGVASIIVRGEDDDKKEITVNMKDVLKKGRLEENVVLMPGDMIIVEESFF